METSYIGKSIPRVDSAEKVTGRAIYSADLDFAGMLVGAALRSPYPHARVLEIDVSEARKIPGVQAVVTGKDFPFTFGGMIKDQPFLAIEKVRFVGEPVAAVAAETETIARQALEKIRVRYQELPAVFDPREAMAEGAPILHENLKDYPRSAIYEVVDQSNICVIRTLARGEVEKGWAEADEIFEDEFYIHAVAHTPMETHAAAAQFLPSSGDYIVWSASDRPHRLAKELADALGLPLNKVRFLTAYSGGGFGGKGNMVAEAIAVALARFCQGRPVKVLFDRGEELTASQTRHAAYLYLKTGMKKDGTFVAREADIVWDKGAYASKGPDVAYRGALTIFGPYRIPHLKLRTRLVYTNKQSAGAYRGYGTTQVTWACEVQMDIISRKLGIDPLRIRLKNGYVEKDSYINGQIMQGVGLGETLKQASRAIGWGESKPVAEGARRVGRGMATMIKGTSTPSNSACLIKASQDGSLTILTSAVEIGAGQKTVLAQIVAETIGVDPASISIPQSDTLIMPFDFGTTSSRTTFHMGNAARQAAEKIRQRILTIASEVLHVDSQKLHIAGGRIFEDGAVERMTLKALLAQKFARGGTLLEEGYYSPADSPLLKADPGLRGMSSAFWMFATHAVEVEVDTETGVVRVRKIAAAHDVGKAINPMLCEQQIEGSVIMGMSNTLLEQFKMENGRILNDSLADYKIATIMDLPEIVPILVEARHPEGPFGAKGIGEPAAAPTAPAIANAVYDAIGVWIKELPITPEKILAALKKKD